MELEEFENKIRVLWEKPIDELENPEFIKYCEKFVEDETFMDSHFGLSNLLNEYIYFKHQINLNKFHEQYMKDARNFDFDIENEIVLFFYDNDPAYFKSKKSVMLITNKKIYYLLPGGKKGELLLEHMNKKVDVSGRLNHKIIINGLVLGKIDIYDGHFFPFIPNRIIPFVQLKGKKLLQKFFDGIYSNRSLFFPNAKEQDTFVNQFDEKSVQSKSSFNIKNIIYIILIVLIIGVVISGDLKVSYRTYEFIREMYRSSEENLIIQQVKYAKLGSCPEKTLDEMAKGFMGSPSWSSGKAVDGMVFVNLEGDISYHEKDVSAAFQFKFNDDDTFEFFALEFNEIAQNKIMATSLLNKMCGQQSTNEQESPSEVDSSEL